MTYQIGWMVEGARWGKREGKVLHLKTQKEKDYRKTILHNEMGSETKGESQQKIAAKSGACLPLLAVGLISSLSLSQYLHLRKPLWNGADSNIFLFTDFVALFPGQHFT